LLILSNIQISYGNRNVLSGISVSFLPGSLTYLLGLNGAGKSSLLKGIIQLLPYQGSITWQNTDLSLLSPTARARKVAMVHQIRQSLPDFTVQEFVLLGRFPHLATSGVYTLKDHGICEALLEKVELTDFRNRNINSLSGGEQQRAVLAQALAQESEILLLDEPAQHLDPKAKKWLYDMLYTLTTEGITILCATHDLDQLTQTGIRVLGIKHGQLKYEQELTAKSAFDKVEAYRVIY